MAVRLNNNRIVRARADGSVELVDDGRYLIPPVGLQIGADVRAYRGANGDLMFADSLNYQDRKFSDLAVERSKRLYIATDFLTPYEIHWSGQVVSGGTANILSSTANHPGQRQLNSAAASGTGYYYVALSNSASYISAPGDLLTSIFQISIVAGKHYIGPWNGAASPPSGVLLEVIGLIATGKTNDGAGNSNATPSTYTLTKDVWYRSEVGSNPVGSVAYFKIYRCSDGVLVWSDTCTPNYGNALGVFPIFHSVSNVAGGPHALSVPDFLSFQNTVDLVR
jgi:hypothetical protein